MSKRHSTELQDEEQVQLFVAYVDDFEDMTASDWAAETERLSGFGGNDVLFAVAVDARQYTYSTPGDFPLTSEQMADIAAGDVEPELANDNWADAAIAMADGMRRELGDGGGGGGIPWLFILLLVLVAGIAVWFFLRRRRRKAGAATGPSGEPVDPLAGLSTEELDSQARRAARRDR